MTRKQRNAEILRRYKQNQTPGQLAAEFGISKRMVNLLTQKAGISRPRGRTGKQLTDKEKGRLKDAYTRQGMALREACSRVGCSYEVGRAALKGMGVPLRPRGSKLRLHTDQEEMHMVDLYLHGATMAEIASEYTPSRDKSIVFNVLKRRGVHRRTMAESRHLRGTW